jgi:hypothetical protein
MNPYRLGVDFWQQSFSGPLSGRFSVGCDSLTLLRSKTRADETVDNKKMTVWSTPDRVTTVAKGAWVLDREAFSRPLFSKSSSFTPLASRTGWVAPPGALERGAAPREAALVCHDSLPATAVAIGPRSRTTRPAATFCECGSGTAGRGR